MSPYNEREVLELLQEESTQRKGFEMIVSQYSEATVLADTQDGVGRMKMRTTSFKILLLRHGRTLIIFVLRLNSLPGFIALH